MEIFATIPDSGDPEHELDVAELPHKQTCVHALARLLSKESPYRERPILVWQGNPDGLDQREPDLYGHFRNASMTHLGSLEVVRLDDEDNPRELAFIALDDIRGVVFAPPTIFRYGKLLYDDGRPDEIVLLPLLYGTSWRSRHARDRDGSITRFAGHLKIPGSDQDFFIGVGHQDFVVRERATLFGLSSIGEIMVPLEIDDPRFEMKCHARGLDPAEVRQQVSGS
jgi:hypothetical protein